MVGKVSVCFVQTCWQRSVFVAVNNFSTEGSDNFNFILMPSLLGL